MKKKSYQIINLIQIMFKIIKFNKLLRKLYLLF
jgi:hypothetical protein